MDHTTPMDHTTEHDGVAPWRAIVAAALDWREARVPFDDAVDGLPVELLGERPPGHPHSAWELVEHVRIAQRDLVAFMDEPHYQELAWPAEYWPATPAPADGAAWESSLAAVREDRERLRAIALRPGLDLTARIPRGTGQTYLRTLLVAVDHAAYHVGQIVLVRRALGAWPPPGGGAGGTTTG